MRIFINLLLLAALFLFARWFVGFGVGAPFLPIRKRDIQDAFSLVEISAHDTIIDLGSGDGRILVQAAKRSARVIGYEINPFLVWFSRLRLRQFGKRATIFNKNLLQADLKEATVIFIFGIEKLMPKIAQLIKTQGRAELKIISFAFDLPGMNVIAEKGITKLYTPVPGTECTVPGTGV